MRISPLIAIFTVFCLVSCAEKSVSDKQESGKSKTESTPSKAVPAKTLMAKTVKKSPATTTSKTDDATPKYMMMDDLKLGWIELFDRRTLFGWKANSDANWSVKDGAITADSGKEGLLLTTVPFANFTFACICRVAEGGNSGIFLRSVFDPKDPARDCYEFNICDSHATYPTGSLVGRKKTDVKVRDDGQWKSFYITVRGRRITAEFDGRTVIDFTDDSENFRLTGLIGLQYRKGKIEFKNITLKPLGYESTFAEKDLSSWTTIPGAKGEITNEDGAIHMKGGPGFLQSDRKWGDFIMHVEVRTNAKRVNSGIFFRSMTGDEKNPANGYELQIHNGFKNGDRTQPDDYKTGYGTGSIFRFAKVRWVVPNDEEWFTMTLVAAGNRFATWVNGHQVTAWTDDRKPNENPRRGRRDTAGHLILQAHDDGADVSFRNLWVVETPTEGEKAKANKP